METKRNYLKYSIFFVLIILSVVGAVILSTINRNGKVLSSLSVNESDKTSFDVKYIENELYKDEIITNNSYVREFVDTVNVNYDYKFNASDKFDGSYTYKVVGEILVYEPGNETNDYWKDTTTIVEETTKTFTDKKTVSIDPLAKVDYQKFYDKYRIFKQSNMVTNEAKLLVKLIVKLNGEYEGLDTIEETREVTVTIPLSEPAFKIIEENNMVNENTLYTKKAKHNNEITYKIISIGLWVLAVFFGFIFILVYNKDSKEMTPYYRKLKKILTTYDSIIVNVDKLASLEDVCIAKVTSFEELLDAQQEVRLPINFKEDKKKRMAKFILLRNNFAWVYVLKDGEDDEK